MKIEAKNIKWLALLILVVLGFLVYANSFKNDLFWDDDDGIVNNIYIKDLSYFPKYFSENLIAGSGQISNYWRPLVLISFAVDYKLSSLNPFGYHLTNTILHILAAWLSFLLLYKISGKKFLSLAAAIIFLVHPLQTEAVTYVSGRADSLSAIFVLLGTLTYFNFRQEKNKKYLAVSLLAFTLALLVKEQSITLPGLIFLVELFFFFNKKKWRDSLRYFAPFVLVAVAYFILRITALNFNDLLSGVDYSDVYDSSLKIRLLTFTKVFVKYFSLLFFPFNQHMAYEIAPVTSILSWAFLKFTILVSGLIYIIKKYWGSHKLVIFGLAWFIVLLLPRTNIISINRPLYEHWLYLPMLGFWLAVIILLQELIKKINLKKVVVWYIILFLILYFSALTIKRNFDWRDPITFYEKNLKYTPNSFIQRNNLGMAYATLNRYDDAIKEYQKAIEIADIYPQVHYNLGNALVALGRTQEAEIEYYRTIEMSPQFSFPYNNLLRLAIVKQDETKLKKTLEKMKENFAQEYYLEQAFYAYYSLGKKEKASEIGRELLQKYPNRTDVGLIMLNIR